MATKKSERIGVIVIMVVLLVGAIGSYIAMALSVDNKSKEQSDYLTQYQQYLDQQKEAAQQNADKSEALPNYSARTFDASQVKSLSIEVLSAGSGETVSQTDTVSVSYFGWTSDGKIFDSTKKINTDDTPASLSLSSVIKGWTNGIAGQKVGSIIRLTIPSDQAYGSTGSGIIPADAPLEFIVEIHSTTPAINA
jgi:FKBP-type peptidyl-prolyl cis-trans isomerase